MDYTRQREDRDDPDDDIPSQREGRVGAAD